MGGCSAANCKNHSRKNHRMFTFPKDPVRRKIWTIRCRRENWEPGGSAQLCSAHFEEDQYEQKRADNWKKLKQTAIPTLFNFTNVPSVVGPVQVKERPKPETLLQAQTNYNQSLKMDDSLIPGNAYIVRVVPATSENQMVIKQEIKCERDDNDDMEGEKYLQEDDVQEDDESVLSDMSDDDVSEEESDPCFEEEIPEKISKADVMTYLFCDTQQKLNDIQKLIPGLAQDNPMALSQNLDLKETSKISDIIQASPLMSKFVKMNSKSEKTDMLHKISMLERKLEHFRKQRKIDKNKVKTLFQAQRRHLRKIDALKKNLVAFQQQKSEYVNTFTLLDLLDGGKGKNLDNPNEFSAETRKFAKELYAISHEAYLYVRNNFGKVLPHDRTITKWVEKEMLKSHSNYEPSSSKNF